MKNKTLRVVAIYIALSLPFVIFCSVPANKNYSYNIYPIEQAKIKQEQAELLKELESIVCGVPESYLLYEEIKEKYLAVSNEISSVTPHKKHKDFIIDTIAISFLISFGLFFLATEVGIIKQGRNEDDIFYLSPSMLPLTLFLIILQLFGNKGRSDMLTRIIDAFGYYQKKGLSKA